jgi:hypothetical protein
MPIHQAGGSLRRPNGGSRRIRRDTKNSSDDDFRDMGKIANAIDSHRVRPKNNPGSALWQICVIRSQILRASFMSYFSSCPSKSHIPVTPKD